MSKCIKKKHCSKHKLKYITLNQYFIKYRFNMVKMIQLCLYFPLNVISIVMFISDTSIEAYSLILCPKCISPAYYKKSPGLSSIKTWHCWVINNTCSIIVPLIAACGNCQDQDKYCISLSKDESKSPMFQRESLNQRMSVQPAVAYSKVKSSMSLSLHRLSLNCFHFIIFS